MNQPTTLNIVHHCAHPVGRATTTGAPICGVLSVQRPNSLYRGLSLAVFVLEDQDGLLESQQPPNMEEPMVTPQKLSANLGQLALD